jgi:hypothetical protein
MPYDAETEFLEGVDEFILYDYKRNTDRKVIYIYKSKFLL